MPGRRAWTPVYRRHPVPPKAGGHPAPDAEGETSSGLPPRRRRYAEPCHKDTAAPLTRGTAALAGPAPDMVVIRGNHGSASQAKAPFSTAIIP